MARCGRINFIIPYTATNKSGAEAIINPTTTTPPWQPKWRLGSTMCPVKGAREELAKTDPELAQSEWIFRRLSYWHRRRCSATSPLMRNGSTPRPSVGSSRASPRPTHTHACRSIPS